ncbi:Uncharacterized membrane protein YesL [Gracilibacillus ureilyticus]|uniref:Uncharacterized membrane protein YesL n=2 Tax=Gracilibacillus ureilyticus TaxID=531814 RepID=A0A1H9MXY1_9BACI|nr:Uncharacterized membrane protein YesL [Gracilibacillus ureilyticus]
MVESLDRILKALLKIVWLNFLWFASALTGLLIFGIFPATVALLTVSHNVIEKKLDFPIYHHFINIYKKEFGRANLSGWLLVLCAIILYLNYQIIDQSNGQVPLIVVFSFYFLIIIYSLVAIWIFPLMSCFEGNIIQYLKNAIIIGLTKFIYTILNLLCLTVCLYISLEIPAMFLFVTAGLTGILVMSVSVNVFSKTGLLQRTSLNIINQKN